MYRYGNLPEACESNSDEMSGTSITELTDALVQMENSLSYGEKAKLQIISDELPNAQELDEFYRDLISAGFHTSKPTARIANGFPLTEITLTKGSPVWAALIPLVPAVLIMGLIAFGIVKIEEISKALVPLLLISGGIAIGLVALVTRPSVMRAAEKGFERLPARTR